MCRCNLRWMHSGRASPSKHMAGAELSTSAAKDPMQLPRECCTHVQGIPNPCTKPDCAQAARADLDLCRDWCVDQSTHVALSSVYRGAQRCFLPSVPPLTITHLSSAQRAKHLLWASRKQNWGRISSMEGYLLVSAVSYSLSRSSSKMSTSTLAFPTRSGARLMRFLASVMESLSPLLHSMGSSRMAAAEAKAMAEITLGRDPARLSTPLSPTIPFPLGSPVPRKQPRRQHLCYC